MKTLVKRQNGHRVRFETHSVITVILSVICLAAPQIRGEDVEKVKASILKDVFVADWKWRRDGFGTVMMADFRIKNDSGWDVKDVKIIVGWPDPAGRLSMDVLRLRSQAQMARIREENAKVRKEVMDAKLLKWHLEQATNGYPSAQCSLGLRYLKGDGVPKDLALARHWLQKSASQGNPEAASALVSMPKP